MFCKYCGRSTYFGIMRDGNKLFFNSDDFEVHRCKEYLKGKDFNPVPMDQSHVSSRFQDEQS
jgi:hypothetical protein